MSKELIERMRSHADAFMGGVGGLRYTLLEAADALEAKAAPVAYITGQFAGRCIIEPINRAAVLPTGMALYSHPQPSAGVVMPEPYGWIAAGNFYTEREAAISAAGKTPCIEVYSRRQMDASERRSAERQGVAEELARLLNAAGNETRELLARLNGKEVGRG